jgi:hypothetical protein
MSDNDIEALSTTADTLETLILLLQRGAAR